MEQNEAFCIVRTDWMTFFFSKEDFRDADITAITTEAIGVMADIRNFLKVNYTLKEAENAVCYFDSTHCNENGNRSYCVWNERKIHCVSLDQFVHEYAHMISDCNADIVYHPSKLFAEGLAQYVSFHFYDGIASQKYLFFKDASVLKNSNPSEHQMICDLLSENGLIYDANNYNKAFIALLNKYYDVSKVDKNSEFYKYYIGPVFVDYCINQLGGIEKFMAVYNDSVTVIDVYQKSVDDLVMEACAYSTSLFFGT